MVRRPGWALPASRTTRHFHDATKTLLLVCYWPRSTRTPRIRANGPLLGPKSEGGVQGKYSGHWLPTHRPQFQDHRAPPDLLGALRPPPLSNCAEDVRNVLRLEHGWTIARLTTPTWPVTLQNIPLAFYDAHHTHHSMLSYTTAPRPHSKGIPKWRRRLFLALHLQHFESFTRN